jgi:hypothetical protein
MFLRHGSAVEQLDGRAEPQRDLSIELGPARR